MTMDMAAFNTWGKKSATPKIRIVSERVIDNGTSKTMDISALVSSPMSSIDFAQAFREQFKGQAVVVAGTFRDIASTSTGVVYRFVAKKSRPSKPFIDSANMKNLGNGQFMDMASTQIWETVGEGDAARIVQAENDEFESILKNYRARIGVNTAMLVNPVGVAQGDFAAYIDEKGALAHGFVQDEAKDGSLSIVSLDKRLVSNIKVDSVVNAVDPASAPGVRRPAKDIANYDVAMSVKDAKPLLDYLSMIYPPDYIRVLKNLIGS